jgi:hypothetical protein
VCRENSAFQGTPCGVRVNVIPVMVVAGISVLGEADAEPPGIPFPGGGLTRWGINGDLGAAQAAFAALDGLVLQLIAGVDEQGVERAIRYLGAVLAGSAEVRSPQT